MLRCEVMGVAMVELAVVFWVYLYICLAFYFLRSFVGLCARFLLLSEWIVIHEQSSENIILLDEADV